MRLTSSTPRMPTSPRTASAIGTPGLRGKGSPLAHKTSCFSGGTCARIQALQPTTVWPRPSPPAVFNLVPTGTAGGLEGSQNYEEEAIQWAGAPATCKPRRHALGGPGTAGG